MAAGTVECRSCGATNEGSDSVCWECGRALPLDPRGSLGSRKRSIEVFTRHVGTLRPVEESRGFSRRWLALTAILVVVVTVTATLGLRSAGYLGGGVATAGSSASRVNLCRSALGPNCQGYQLTFAPGSGGNVSPCDAISPDRAGAHLVFNYTTTAYMDGVLIPSGYYSGSAIPFQGNPVGFLHTGPAVATAAWDSGLTTGGDAVNASVPSTFADWCLCWWDPGPYGVLTFSADTYLTYTTPASDIPA